MIEVRRIKEGGPLDFEVVVREGEGETRHHVTIPREMCERLTAGKHTPERCLEAAFRFLLDREPKESISRTLRRDGVLALLPRIRAGAAALPLAVLMELCAVFATIRCTLPGYLKILASDRSDQPFAEAVPPRRAWAMGSSRMPRLNVKGRSGLYDWLPEQMRERRRIRVEDERRVYHRQQVAGGETGEPGEDFRAAMIRSR